MKVDKRNAIHWIYLALFLLNVVMAIVSRLFRRRRATRRVILYGHKLGGNLLAIYRQLHEAQNADIEVAFLTMDPAYHRELAERGDSCLLAISPRCVAWLATADAVISDHGLHAMLPMLYLSDMKFFDVWHGIPFKGFNADDFRVQHRYDEVWVASPMLKSLYVQRFGFHPSRVQATGYARTDRLVQREEDLTEIKQRLGLDGPEIGKIVLVAPTWKQDDKERSIYPFGVDERSFLNALSELAKRTKSTFVLRAHLNSGADTKSQWGRILHRPYANFPDTEALLLASDILISDWSSIAFDYLLLDRPTIFLDVEPPFANGFSLDASYRFGAVSGSLDNLLQTLERYLVAPDCYTEEYAGHCERIKTSVYADCADGHAGTRCIGRLRTALRVEFSR